MKCASLGFVESNQPRRKETTTTTPTPTTTTATTHILSNFLVG
jgi:hypothetical protein